MYECDRRPDRQTEKPVRKPQRTRDYAFSLTYAYGIAYISVIRRFMNVRTFQEITYAWYAYVIFEAYTCVYSTRVL